MLYILLIVLKMTKLLWNVLLLFTLLPDVSMTSNPNIKPFLKPVESATGWVIGNSLWNITVLEIYGKKLYFQNHDLIGDAVGHYSGYGIHSIFVCYLKQPHH